MVYSMIYKIFLEMTLFEITSIILLFFYPKYLCKIEITLKIEASEVSKNTSIDALRLFGH